MRICNPGRVWDQLEQQVHVPCGEWRLRSKIALFGLFAMLSDSARPRSDSSPRHKSLKPNMSYDGEFNNS